MATEALAQAQGLIIPIGLSMGGMVALEIWRQAADRVSAMALFDTDPGADTVERRANRDAQINEASQGRFREMVESQLVPGYFSTADHGPSANHDVQMLHSAAVRMALDQGSDAFTAQANALATRPDAWPLLESINVPTLFACGAHDRVCLPENHVQMAARLPLKLATFRSIPASGHLSPLEQPEATAHILRAWLEGVAEAHRQKPRKNTAVDSGGEFQK